MPSQTPDQNKKLVVYVAGITASLAVILTANVVIHDRTTVFAEGAGTPRRAALEKLAANPKVCAMTMEPSPDNERPMRHVNASIIGKVDVLELGQSDADHVSETFFKDDVRFYNGFVSNSYFVYQYEVFLDIARAHGAPPLVLFDVRSGYILTDTREPEWDTPAEDSVWWGFPPFHLGKAKPLPWYRDISSLLSLAQTDLTLTWVAHQLPHAAAPVSASGAGVVETDNGSQFRCVSRDVKSSLYRWLSDGSRVYAGELGGVFAKPGPVRLFENIGDRHVNGQRLVGIDFVLRKIREEGSTVIMYSPPLNPRDYDDPKQARVIQAAGDAVRGVAERNGVDYCDFGLKAQDLGCTPLDFSDETHLDRHCDARVVRELTRGCAPRAGALLASKLNAATLQ